MVDTPPETPESEPDSPADIPPRGWKRILVATWKDAGEDNLSLIAAGVAFYAFLALVPLLTAFVLSYGLVAEPAAVVRHMHTLTSVLPANAASIIGDQLKGMTEGSGTRTGFALLLALGIAVYGASKGAAAIMTALNIVYEVGESRGFVHRTLLALAMSAGMVAVLLLAILAVSALNFLEALLPSLGGAAGIVMKAVTFALAAAAVVLLLAIVYRYGPNRPDAEWRWITPGSGLATLVWIAATLGFGLYVANFGDYNATYGSLGAVIVFLTWLYLTAYVVLFGAELNSILEIEVGREKVRDKDAPPVPNEVVAAAGAAPETAAPSLPRLVARLGMLSVLLRVLGRGRRARALR